MFLFDCCFRAQKDPFEHIYQEIDYDELLPCEQKEKCAAGCLEILDRSHKIVVHRHPNETKYFHPVDEICAKEWIRVSACCPLCRTKINRDSIITTAKTWGDFLDEVDNISDSENEYENETPAAAEIILINLCTLMGSVFTNGMLSGRNLPMTIFNTAFTPTVATLIPLTATLMFRCTRLETTISIVSLNVGIGILAANISQLFGDKMALATLPIASLHGIVLGLFADRKISWIKLMPIALLGGAWISGFMHMAGRV